VEEDGKLRSLRIEHEQDQASILTNVASPRINQLFSNHNTTLVAVSDPSPPPRDQEILHVRQKKITGGKV
jgi:hypothetical protein